MAQHWSERRNDAGCGFEPRRERLLYDAPMKVKIGDRVYDGEEQPIMVVLTDADKANIANMAPECSKYAAFPEGMDEAEVRLWME